ncbi:MAG: hypothetical protein IM504_10490 [Microcystis sp. M038S2]|uniref:hypothetical protein n=1 Tax=unclassified Microcystis TaxID=2643300 RepID=UPI002583BD0B|nr:MULTISPECIES: hypothetical protein [unclassified Microcystis]MCA2683351.1 hypothetical protein [Microcystis sp. M046S2]MCA2705274.1 hypothetical protein [Microcystis sp. M038S2]MCA2954182.1 hypothetical protein [Microcystis sp. M112S1]
MLTQNLEEPQRLLLNSQSNWLIAFFFIRGRHPTRLSPSGRGWGEGKLTISAITLEKWYQWIDKN